MSDWDDYVSDWEQAELRNRTRKLEARIKMLEDALIALVEEYCDYTIINKLGDPEKQHNIKRARKALEEAPKAPR